MVNCTRLQISFVETMLSADVYDKHRSNRKWVSGPNELFYRMFSADGDLFQAFTRHYAFVQQLEGDICPIKDGWLTEIARHADPAVPVSGARLRTACMFSASTKTCRRMAELPGYVKLHVNGNALYSVSDALQQLINAARTLYDDWPFDLAIYLAANATGQLHGLRYADYLHNLVYPIHIDYAFDARLHAPSTYLVHMPSHMRSLEKLEAALAPLDAALPVTLAVAGQAHSEYLRNLHASLARVGVGNVVLAGLDEEVMGTILEFGQEQPFFSNVTTDIADEQHLGLARLTILREIVGRGYHVFSLDVRSYVVHNYIQHLLGLDRACMHFASDAVQSYGGYFHGEDHPRYMFTDAAVYASNSSAQFLDAWSSTSRRAAQIPSAELNVALNCTNIKSCRWKSTPVRLLDPAAFVHGLNIRKQWPASNNSEPLLQFSTFAQPDQGKIYRFRATRSWVLPSPCCAKTVRGPTQLVITEDVSTVEHYIAQAIDLLEFARQTGADCVVTPTAMDVRTGLTTALDSVFDIAAISRVYNLAVYPSADSILHCAAYEDITREQQTVALANPDIRLFSYEIIGAVNAVGALLKPQPYTCIADGSRPLAEVALYAFKHALPALFKDVVEGSTGAVFLAGKWRLIAPHVRKIYPDVTMFTPDVLGPGAALAFGLRAHYARQGEDFHFDVVDILVCSNAATVLRAARPPMPLTGMFAELLRLVPASVLLEERLLGRQMVDSKQRSIFTLEETKNNGFFNLVNSLQTMGYLARRLNATAIMLPFSASHLAHDIQPWSAVIDADRLFSGMRQFRPSVWALLKHPCLLVEALDDMTLPVFSRTTYAQENVEFDAHHEYWTRLALQLYTPRAFLRVFVASNPIAAENLKLHGQVAAVGAGVPHLGLTESQLSSVVERWLSRGRDITLRTFRAFNFQTSEPKHLQYAARWKASFQVNQAIQLKTTSIIDAMPRDFTCIHARLNDEFLALHASQTQFQRASVISKIREFANIGANATLYITSDVGIRQESIANSTSIFSASIFTCHDFGCSNDSAGANVLWGLVENSVCGAASVFKGNIYSTFTLGVCAKRDDQVCNDLLGQSLKDGRLLF